MADAEVTWSATEHSVPRLHDVTFKLRWPSGALIGEFTASGVERFVQDLEEGLVAGVVRRRSGDEADYDEPTVDGHYRLLWGTIELQDGPHFCDYNMPDGAELTLVHDRRAHIGA